MKTLFTDNDPHACGWLRELVAAGHLEGDVLERSITDLTGPDLTGYRRVHLFAGIGGWELALRLAGWPADRPVWTGSCPCQPYSAAGKGEGDADPRNLWPQMFRLVRECRPATVFGEQVAGAIKHGWLDRVFADLEAEGYACGAAVLGAHSVGAPHIRQRIFWAAHTGHRQRGRTGQQESRCEAASVRKQATVEPQRRGAAGGMGDAFGSGIRPRGPGEPGGEAGEVRGDSRQQRIRPDAGAADGGCPVGLGDSAGDGQEEHQHAGDVRGAAGAQPEHGRQDGGEGPAGTGAAGDRMGESGGERLQGSNCPRPTPGAVDGAGGAGLGPWSNSVLIPCRDGKWRRVPGTAAGPQPTLFPLAHGVPGRVGALRGAGNAIVPQVAAIFIRAFLEAEAAGFTD